MGIAHCCWKRWWTHSAFEELATGPPTGSTLGRPPVADEWTESTKPTVKPSKISTCTRWSAMPGNAYAASSSGKQIPELFIWMIRTFLQRLQVGLQAVTHLV